MSNQLITIQYNSNPWQLGISFESHANLKKQLNPDNSTFLQVVGMNNFVLGNEPYAFWLRRFSRNRRSLHELNKQLKNNCYLDGTNYSRSVTRKFRHEYENMGFNSIIRSAEKSFGINGNSAMSAVKLALVDKFKLWNIFDLENLVESKNLLIAYIATYVMAKDVLLGQNYKYLNIYNSRFLNERATKDAAMDIKIKTFEFEQVNSRSDSFGIFETNVHDPVERALQAREQFKEVHIDGTSENKYAREWIAKRRNESLQKFTRHQVKGKLPSIPKDKKLLSCFLSSFDELLLAGYTSKESSLNQSNALQSLSEEIAMNQDWQLVIRCHPNMLTRPDYEQNYWKKLLKGINAIVVLPEDDIDTYALIERSDLVVTFGSTVAVEALALGVPSAVFGESLYSGHQMVKTLNSIQELLRLLRTLPKINKKQLLELEVYAYFQLYGGERFRYLELKEKDIYNFNPKLFWHDSLAFGPEKGLSVLSQFYSKIQFSKKSKIPFTS